MRVGSRAKREVMRYLATALSWILLASVGSLPTHTLQAQQVQVIDLSAVAAQSSDGFTRVSGIRELRDGRVILVDSDDRSVHLLDSRLSLRRLVGRQGAGPGEYRLPREIVALEGDSTVVFDGSQGRLLVITPDGRPGGFLGIFGRNAGPAGWRSPARTADRRGYLYARTAGVARSTTGDVTLTDSAAIERWHRDASRRDTIAFISLSRGPGTRVMAGMVATPAGERNPFGSEPQWAIAEDGTLAIVHVEPYRVEFVRPDGTRQAGSAIPYQPIRVSEGHKEAWRAEMRRPRPMLVVRFEDKESGVVIGTFPFREPKNWPSTLPPFVSGGTRFAPDGTLWVQRTTVAAAPPTFDVFASSGKLLWQVRLPKMTRLVGFGEKAVYVVRKDEVDLEYLQRILMR